MEHPHPEPENLPQAILQLARAIDALVAEAHSKPVILDRITQLENKLMSAISDFTDKVNARFDQMGGDVDTAVAGVDSMSTSVSGIAADVKFLKDTITQINNNPGPISADDQKLLDAVQARTDALAAKTATLGTGLATLKDTLAALDAATEEPPAPPTP